MVKCLLPVSLFGLVLIGAGIFIIVFLPWYVKETIRSTFKMETPTSSPYSDFFNSSGKGVHVYKTFYLFNVENPQDVTYYGAKPIMKKVGPFTYREIETYNESMTSWHPNATMQYRSYADYFFVPELSHDPDSNVINDENMSVTVPSMALLGFIKQIRYLRDCQQNNTPTDLAADDFLAWWTNLGNDALSKEPLFISQPVKALLFGYYDPLMAKLEELQGETNDVGIVPLNPDSDPYAYAHENGNDEMYTGGQPSKTSPPVPDNAYKTMTKWHGYSSMPGYWGSDYANLVSGTDATGFHTFVTRGEKLLVWVNSLARKINITYDSDIDVNGVTLYRHRIDPDNMKSQSEFPENGAYYMTHHGWLPTPPKLASRPINFTKPVFLEADPSLIENLTFPYPAVPEDHETWLDVEPMTGSLFQVHKRLQINAQIEPFDWYRHICALNFSAPNWQTCHNKTIEFNQTKNVVKTMVPVFYLDQHMLLPDSLFDSFKNDVLKPLLLAKVLGGLSIALGSVLIISAVVVKVLEVRRAERNLHDHEFYMINNRNQKEV